MTDASADSIQERKAALRAAALARRDALEIDDRLEWDAEITQHVLAILTDTLSPHSEEAAQAAVSKDGPAVSRASAGILRDAPAGAPQDEGSGIWQGGPASAYWPMRSEADPRPIMEALHARGVALCLPAIVEKRMIFRRWAPYEPIVPGGFGTLVPDPREPQVLPTILIVPLAAFDRRGYRIGYGKGYYDRALSELGRVVSIGIGYAAQEIDAVPNEPHDQRLDWIVTERGVIACN